MADDPPSDVRSRYRDFLRRTTERVDTRIILQMQRIIALKLDEIFVPLTAREEPRNRKEEGDLIRAAAEAKSVEEHFDPTFDLILIREGRSRLSELGRTGVSISELLHESPLNVLLGDPGSGKSTVLRWLIRQWANAPEESAAPGEAALLPVPVTLRYFAAWLGENPSAGKSSLADFLGRAAWEETTDAADFGTLALQHAADGKAILLLDGLDEALDADARRAVVDAVIDFLDAFPRCQCLVTSRVVGYDSAPLPASFSAWRVEPFADEGVRLFYEKWALAIERSEDILEDDFTHRRAKARREDIHAALGLSDADSTASSPARPDDALAVRELARNPMLATLIGLIHHQGRRLPRDRAELYRLCLEAFIYDWESLKRVRREDLVSLDKNETLDVLEEIAFRIHDEGGANRLTAGQMALVASAFLEKTLGMDRAAAEARAARLINLIGSRAGLLIDRGNRTADPASRELGFSHLQFQEYLAGRALVRRRRDIPALLRPRVWQARWREPILLAAAYLGEQNASSASEFIEMVWDTPAPAGLAPGHRLEVLLPHAEFLALECVRDTPRIELPLRRRAHDRLRGIFIDEIRTWRWSEAARIVGDEGLKLAASSLSTALQKEDPSLRWAAVQALGALHAPEALGPLLRSLQTDDSSFVRQAAAHALGALRAPEALGPLLSALKEETPEVRQAAARALGALRAPEALGPLLAALRKGENAFVCQTVAQSLGTLGAPEALGPLLTALNKENILVRWAVVDALGALHAPEALGPLLSVLQADDDFVRQAAARALGALRAPEALGPLLSAMQTDENSFVRQAAARALGALRAPEALGPLLAALKKEAPEVRQGVIEALGALRAPETLGPLLTALQRDDAFFVRQVAAQALGALRAPEALGPLLTALQQDDHPFVRWTAADALGALRAPEALGPLLTALQEHDEEYFVREAAAKALKEIGSKEAIPTLATMLASEANRVFWPSIEDALTAIVCG